MAKQTGLHQIRGKVGEHSYYRQSGVSSGLIRGINPGMSSRVKTSPEYANTRLNNKEFKTASRMAASMIDGIVPRMRPMFNTFKNAKLSAGLLEIIKSKTTGVWGLRFIGLTDRDAACVVANKLAKNNFDNYVNLVFGEFHAQDSVQDITLTSTSSLLDILQSMGATGLNIECRQIQVYEGLPTDEESARLENIVRLGVEDSSSIPVSDINSGVILNVERGTADLTILSGRTYLSFYVVVLMPYRTVGETKHILQEGCTYAYFIDPEQDT